MVEDVGSVGGLCWEELGDDWFPVGEGTGLTGGFSWLVVGVCCGDVPAGLARLARRGQLRFSWFTLPQVKHDGFDPGIQRRPVGLVHLF